MKIKSLSNFYQFFSNHENTDFIIGKDSFEDIVISDSKNDNGFWYFKNIKKGLIKRFIIEIGQQVYKVCEVTLIKNSNNTFSPRFSFYIYNITNKTIDQYKKEQIDDILIKGRINLDTCHKNFLLFLDFILKTTEHISSDSQSLTIIKQSEKDIFENLSKDVAVSKFTEKYGKDISERDVELLLNRRSKLNIFKKLLEDSEFFNSQKKSREIKNDEGLWQAFFESNSWIFGYGLQLVSCENLDNKKLETIVAGSDIIGGPGKRIDALLKTKGNISKFLLCEIKTHHRNLLVEKYDRPGVFVPGKELRGAVAQVQKSIHKMTLQLQSNYIRPTMKDGVPSGEEILFVKPRGLVVIGLLDDFKTDSGINYEMLSSFELYRQQIQGIDIITYDELYERVKFIVEK